jgi:hypothetical protein
VIFRALSAVNLNLAAVALNKLLCNKQTDACAHDAASCEEGFESIAAGTAGRPLDAPSPARIRGVGRYSNGHCRKGISKQANQKASIYLRSISNEHKEPKACPQ